MYGFSKQMAGKRARLVFPLVGTIFLFLLMANWMKLLPGVESVGVMHCAEVGLSGYPVVYTGSAYQYWIDQSLDAGTGGTEENLHACEEFKYAGVKPTQEDLEAAAEHLTAEETAIMADEALTPAEQELRIAEARIAAVEHLFTARPFR